MPQLILELQSCQHLRNKGPFGPKHAGLWTHPRAPPQSSQVGGRYDLPISMDDKSLYFAMKMMIFHGYVRNHQRVPQLTNKNMWIWQAKMGGKDGKGFCDVIFVITKSWSPRVFQKDSLPFLWLVSPKSMAKLQHLDSRKSLTFVPGQKSFRYRYGTTV